MCPLRQEGGFGPAMLQKRNTVDLLWIPGCRHHANTLSKSVFPAILVLLLYRICECVAWVGVA
jgi:hypothetical protein